MSQDSFFGKAMWRVNFYLKVIDLGIDEQDSNRSFRERIRKRWLFMINILILIYDCVGQVIWLIEGVINGTSTILENTLLIPCLILCSLGVVKSYFLLKHAVHVNDLIRSLTKLQSIADQSTLKLKVTKKWITFLMTANTILFIFNFGGVLTFALGPIIKTALSCYRSGPITYNLAYFVWYPVDAYSLPYWPFIYLNQTWSAVIAAGTVFGPDCLYYTSCSFINIQFKCLQFDLKDMIARNANVSKIRPNEIIYTDIGNLVELHMELIRCVSLVEIIYSKSTLFNILSSSLIVCVTGFNIMSVEVSNAVYDSNWYECRKSEILDYLNIMIRAQSPCKVTAYGFSDVNLRSFSRIISTAYSYFALLVTMYSK